MAEVFLAVQEGLGGFEKLVVIKRIFRQYCEDERFVQMFLDEARLAATIRHPNVVEILDIGHDEEGYFIVMEYLGGETLHFVARELHERKQTAPPHIICRIGAAVASGLHDAHVATDAAGDPHPVIHRDVTLSNVIVCYNGVVKLVDFGVAKAVASDNETRVGGIKGKLSYLAPEQIRNEAVDARTDIFQLGIVLHEMLTGRRLFNAPNDHQKVLAVMQREIPPPSRINSEVPELIDPIVLGALEREREKRTQSADDLRAQLEDALKELGMSLDRHEIGTWMRESFPEAYTDRLALEHKSVSQIRRSRQMASSGVAAVSTDNAPRASSHYLGDGGRLSSTNLGSGSMPMRPSWSQSPSHPVLGAGKGSQPNILGNRASQPNMAAGFGASPGTGAGFGINAGTNAGFGSNPGTGSGFAFNPGTASGSHSRSGVILPGIGGQEGTGSSSGQVIYGPQPSRSRRGIWVLVVLLMVVAAGGVGALVVIRLGPPAENGRAAVDDTSAPGPSTTATPGSVVGKPAPGPGAATQGTDPNTTARNVGNSAGQTAAPAPVPATYAVAVTTVPTNARIQLNGTDAGTGSMTRTLPRDGATHKLVISASGYESRELTFTDQPPPSRVELQPVKVAKPEARQESRQVRSPPPRRNRPRRRPPPKKVRTEPAAPAPAPVEPAPVEEKPPEVKKPKKKKPPKRDVFDEPMSDNIDPWSDN